MSKIGKALSKAGAKMPDLGLDADGDYDGDEAPMSGEGTDAGEVSAARIMMRAKSPEEYAGALKDFLELCVPKLMEKGSY